MNNNDLIKQLRWSTNTLLELTRETCWNTLSNDCVYLITRISESDDREIKKKKLPRNTELLTLEELAVELEKLYPQIYDLCFFIYQAQKSRTIIELQYFPKSALDQEFLLKVKDQSSMIHYKIKIPPYWQDRTKPFDVNWELGGFRHHWYLFLARIRYFFLPSKSS
jgi:hypothetical protein